MKKLTIFLLTFCLIFLCSCGENDTQTVNLDEPYATVNGETITVEEIEYFKTRDRADIINEFAEKYKVTDFSNFWDKEFDGSTPTQALTKRALDDAVSAKIKLIEMKKQGIFDDISFNGLQALAQEYNEAHENLPATVGVSSIDMTSFYTYYVQTGEMELENRLEEDTDYDEYINELIENAEVEITEK